MWRLVGRPLEMQFEARKTIWTPPERWLRAARGASGGSAPKVNNMEISHCKNIWNHCGILKIFRLLMHFDALSLGIVDFSLVFRAFAARRKSIMQELSHVQKYALFLLFWNNSGHDAASSNAEMLYFHWFYNSASGTTRSYHAPANNAKYGLSQKRIIPIVFQQCQCFQAKSMSLLNINLFALHWWKVWGYIILKMADFHML